MDGVTAQIAKVLRTRREEFGMTLRMLATKSGVSASMISDIERAAKSPTISTLSALAEALEMPISALVDGERPAGHRMHIVRGSERPTMVDPISGARMNSFGPTLAGSKVTFLQYAVPPHAVAGPFAAHASGTIEHIYVAKGRIQMRLGNDMVMLDAGDSYTCIADTPHAFDNGGGDDEALIYIVIELP
jgi:mannose-6-phosphate isomerase-like protein (cupin superfamily)/DNA-binding XRE family transcriptional regulator